MRKSSKPSSLNADGTRCENARVAYDCSVQESTETQSEREHLDHPQGSSLTSLLSLTGLTQSFD